MSRPLPIAVSLIAKNEAANIRRCLDSVKGWCAEIVVVCNDCTDDTESIVTAEYAGRVVRETWHGYREQKNLSLNLATQPWVLCLDADEVVSPELRAAITRFVEADGDGADAAEFARCSHFMGRWIRHGDWYPDRCLRLIRRGAGAWGGDRDHTRIITTGRITRLSGDLLHHPYRNMGAQVRKIAAQSDDFVEKAVETGRTRFSLFKVLTRPPFRFLRAYLLRLGFLDGFPGFYIAASNAFAVMLKHARLRELDDGER